MKKYKNKNNRIDDLQSPFVAAQNSLIENCKIKRYDTNPYLKPSSSAPTTIHPTPNVSREVSKDSFNSGKLHSKSSIERRKIQALLEEPGQDLPRIIKAGKTVGNSLQAKLYNHPTDSDILKTIRAFPFQPHGIKNKTKHEALNTFRHARIKRTIDSSLNEKNLSKRKDESLTDLNLSVSSRQSSLKSISSYSSSTLSSNTSLNSICQEYYNKTILEIIFTLHKRLNWPCDCILQGDCPPTDIDEGVDTEFQRLEDDGEFVYCIPGSQDYPVNIYDLVFVSPKQAQLCNPYYTVSASYVSRVSSTEGTSIVPIYDWIHERKMYNSICNIDVFKKFRIWKSFTIWKEILRQNKKEDSSTNVSSSLFIVTSPFQETLLAVQSLCKDLCMCQINKKSDKYLSFLHFDLSLVNKLGEFCKIHELRCQEIRKSIQVIREDVLKLVLATCKNYYTTCLADIELKMKDLEQKELLNLIGGVKVKQKTKNFQLIKDKYKITEKPLPIDPVFIMAQKKKNSFKHIRLVHLKNIHQKLRSFVRLVDFMLMETLRTTVITAVNVINKQLDASFNTNQQINLYKQCGWFHEEVKLNETQPFFQVDLVLAKESKDGCTDETKLDLISTLVPTTKVFTAELKAMFDNFECTFTSYKSLLTEEVLQTLLNDPHCGVVLNYEEEDRIYNKTKFKNWPNKELIFSNDLSYQKSISSIMENIEKGMDQVTQYTKQFDVFCGMISITQPDEVEQSLQQEWTSEQYCNILRRYTEQVSEMYKMPLSHRAGMFLIKTDVFQRACLPYPQKIISTVNKHLPAISVRKNDELLIIIKDGERKLSAPIKVVGEFVSHLSYLTKIAADVPALEKEYAAICKLFTIAFDYSAEFTPEQKALYQTLGPSFHQLKTLIMYCEATKDDGIQKYSKELESIIDGLMKTLHNLTNQIKNPSLIDEDMAPSVALERISFFREDLTNLTDNAKDFAEYENLFKSALSSSVKKRAFESEQYQSNKSESKVEELQLLLSVADKDLSLRALLWESLDEWKQLHTKWNATVFSSLDILLLQKEVSRFVQTVYLLEKSLPHNTVVPNLKKIIMSFQIGMPIISSLRNSALKHRHWQQITEMTGIFFKDDRFFTLGKLMQLDLQQFQEDILEVSSQATNEATLEQMLTKVKDYWKVTDIQLLAHSSRSVPIIGGIDDILYALDDSMVTLANIRSSRFSLPLHNEIGDWDRKLALFLRTFEEWIVVQRNWLYLENIFAAQDIQRQLPNEAKLFTKVDKNWRDIMRRTVDSPNALSSATTAGLLEVLQACNSNLEKIHRSLEEYLETKRLVFSRFYFLSNEELLDILANSKNVLAVQPYLMKCFANIKKLQFDITQRSPVPICSMQSMEGEIIKLPKSLKARGQVEHWLVNVESVMFDSIKSMIKTSLPTFHHINFISWIQKQHGQIASVIVQIIFAKNVDEIYMNNNDSVKVFKSLTQLYCSLKVKLDLLAAHVKSYIEEYERNTMVGLIILLVHQRDIVNGLLQNKVETNNDFQWIRELRYCWDETTNSCNINQSIASFSYGYEYLGCSMRLVITPLTSRCYLTLTGALHFYLGGAPSGPAGTGKSETVKDLAKALGKQCIVFNCSEGLDFKMIGRFLSGLSQSGCWCCFDEFNRIDIEVLSVIAQQLHIIKSAKAAGSLRFMFEGKDIRLISSSAVFITMNPGYAGRVDLPDNLKSMFRPVSMVKPDNRQIAEIILFSNGFSSAAELSSKLVNLYELANRQLSQQAHYDFGLRAIKALLLLAGDRNQNQLKSETDNKKEEAIIIRAIQDSNFSKLISEDAKLFQQLLEDIFPAAPKQRSESIILEKSIGIALRELSLQRWPSQVQKVIQFHNTLNIRHGVMLIGPSGGGKTTVRNILKKALTIYEAGNKLDENKEKDFNYTTVDMVTINPKSISVDELYGKFDSNTAEWTDGLLSSNIRQMVSNNTEKLVHQALKSPTKTSRSNDDVQMQDTAMLKSLYQWLVLDGPVDTLWVENLNTVLDDSKLLCLANGERISILPSMKIIFEVDSLEQASPATISRCGMIYLDPAELGWQPLVRSWLRKLRTLKISEEMRDHLWRLFENSIEQGVSFLQTNHQHILLTVPTLSIVQMLCNLLECFFSYIFDAGGFVSSDENIVQSDSKKSEENLNHLFGNLKEEYDNKKKKSNVNFFFYNNEEAMKKLFEKLYVFSYMWSFGGHFDCTSEEAEEMDQHFRPSHGLNNDLSIQHLCDIFLRTLFESQLDIHLPTGNTLLYSFYVDIEKGQFLLWDQLIRGTVLQPETRLNHLQNNTNDKNENFISTPISTCYSFLIALLSANQHPVLLTGLRGCGKSVLLQNVLSRLSQPGGSSTESSMILGEVLAPAKSKSLTSIVSLTDMFAKEKVNQQLSESHEKIIVAQSVFSALTDANKPKEAIKCKLVKRSREVMGTRNGEKVIVFIDDLNMPQPDLYGSQPPLEVLREFLDYGGYYDTKLLQWKSVMNVSLITACSQQQHSKQNQNERLLQKFCTLSLPQSSSQALHHIFYTQLKRGIDPKEFTKEVCMIRSDVVSTVLGVYHDICAQLKTTPFKSHYLFNLRDVSKVICGLLQAHPTVIRTSDRFIELTVHEISRVFLDQLVSEQDRNIFFDITLDKMHEYLKIKWGRADLINHQVAFGDFFEANVPKQKRVYQSLHGGKKLQQILEDYHDRCKLTSTNIPDQLVFFPTMCQHVVAAARVLRQSNGHMLLLGIGGTGKKTVVQLASFLTFCEFSQPAYSKTYTLNDFTDDLKKVILKAGLKGERMVFYVDDRNIVKESFLELVCNILNATDLSMFIDPDEKEGIVVKLKSEATSQSVADTVDDIYEFFESRVRKYLHVIFATSPSGSLFHQRCQLYPSLVNNSTVNWYAKWPTDALETVSHRFLMDDFSFESQLQAQVVKALVYSHEFIDSMCQQFYVEHQRYYHVTPKSFLDFVFLFIHVYKKKVIDSKYKQERLLSGLGKLEETNHLVEQMKIELLEMGPKLEQKTIDTEKLLLEISTDREKVNKVRSVVKHEEEVTDRETKKVEAIATDAQHDLDNALPQLELATAALDSLNKYDIGEIRSYANPPTMVMTVLSAVCVCLNEKPDWPTAKQLLGEVGFLKRLINYDHQNVEDKIYLRVKKYTKQSEFNPTAIGKISVACKSMCSWVIALENYTRVHRLVKPKQEKCKEAKIALKEARAKLLTKQQSLRKVEDQLKSLEDRYFDSVKQLEELKATKQLTMVRLDRAASLIKALTSEKDRWSVGVQSLTEESEYLLSQSIISASAISYMGAFIPSYRIAFLDSIKEMLIKNKIKVHQDFDFVASMTEHVQIQNWMNCGLPHDNHSNQNALIIENTQQWPFIIDPQYQAAKWIKGKEKENVIKVIKASDSGLMNILENSIRLGEVVIIQNASEQLDPALDPILTKQLVKRGNQHILTIGETEIQYNTNFRLYILSNDKNPQLLPELCIKVAVVNFIITKEGLTDQVLSKVVLQENPELEKQRNDILEILVAEQLRLTSLEDLSLTLLHQSKGNILDDEKLIETLDKSKTVAEEIKVRVKEAEATQEQLNLKRQIYLPLAERGVLLYFIASDLPLVDSMYQFSLAWFLDLFCKCIDLPNEVEVDETVRPSSARGRLIEAKKFALSTGISRRKLSLLFTVNDTSNTSRMKMMKELVTETFYKAVSYTLFAQHQILLSFYLAMNVLINEGGITQKEYSMLMETSKSTLSSDEQPSIQSLHNVRSSLLKVQLELESSPIKSISLSQWQELSHLQDSLSCFYGLLDHIREYQKWWNKFMDDQTPMLFLKNEENFEEQPSDVFRFTALTDFQCLLLLKILRPDNFTHGISLFISNSMGTVYNTPSGFDLQDIYNDSNCRTPIMFVLSPGSDPSSQLLRFVKEVRGSSLHLDMMSLGRFQGPKAVDSIKKAYMQKGNWVFLQNCHLALSFMPQLEEIVRDINDPEVSINPQFRLWLSSRPDVNLPVSILQASMKVTVEPPPGVKNSLQNTFTSVGGLVCESFFEDVTIHHHWKQLVYSVCLFHAVLQERRKFRSLGWNILYDFITADLEVALLTLSDVISNYSDIPWNALRSLTGEIIYGGRVTDVHDQRCLRTMLEKFYTPRVIETDFIYLNTKLYTPPQSDYTYYDCVKMIESLPGEDCAEIFGMTDNAIYECHREECFQLIDELKLMQPHSAVVESTTSSRNQLTIRKAEEILAIIPNKINIVLPKSRPTKKVSMVKTSTATDGTASPLDVSIHVGLRENAVYITLEQERLRFNHLLSTIHESLTSLCEAINGQILITKSLEEVAQSLLQNKVPTLWKMCSFKSCKNLSAWIVNLKKRVSFITRWIECLMLGNPTILPYPRAIWLPAFFYPQGILTAILQNHSRKIGQSVDLLSYQFEITSTQWISQDANSDCNVQPNNISFKKNENPNQDGVLVFGLFLDGAFWDSNNNTLSKCSMRRRVCPLPEIHFIPKCNASSTEVTDKLTYECPLYQTSKRRNDQLNAYDNFVIELNLPTNIPSGEWVLSGVAALCQTDD